MVMPATCHYRSCRAGFPAYTPGETMSLVTTDPAPITTSLHIATGRIVALEPTNTRLPSRVGFHRLRLPLAGAPAAKVSLMNMTPCAITQSSPIVTSSQTNECDWIRVRGPIVASRWISTNGPMNAPSPILHPYRFTGLTITTFAPNSTLAIPASRTTGSVMICAQPAALRAEFQLHRLFRFDRLVDCGNQLETSAAFQTIHEVAAVMQNALHDVLVVRTMAVAVDVRGVYRVFLHHTRVLRHGLGEAPRSHLVHCKARYLHGAALAENGERPLQILRPGRGRRLYHPESAIAEA